MINEEYKRRLIELAKEVSTIFGYNTINTRSMRLEVDMSQIGKLWSLIAFIMALENEGTTKMNGSVPVPPKEEVKEEINEQPKAEETQPEQPTEQTNNTE